MRSNTLNATLKKAVFTVTILLLAVSASLAQVNLTAGAQNVILPDGQIVPMWGYTCTAATAPNTCRALNAAGGWSPVLITAPTDSTLTINLTNNLTFGANGVPTSLVIVGQLGGGLGTSGTTDLATAFPHTAQGTTWPVQGGIDTSAGDAVFTPPDQAGRVRSFAQEVTNTNSATLTWANLKAGTYLIESGTHPSIQGPMGLYGILVVTNTSASPATAYPGVTYNADVPLLLSEIDAVQNRAVDAAVKTTGFVETKKWNGATGECGDPTVHTCYPAAVNFDPRYYLINGAAFDRTQTAKSLFATAPATGVTGTVLVRFVNAGLRMHVPSIVGALTNDSSSGTLRVVSGFSLIAEDGNALPGNPKVQSEVFLSAGKTYDVLINAPANGAPALPVFDRQLSLSTNNQRDGGMQAYIGVNGGTLPAAAGLTPFANADSYLLVSGKTLTVSDPGRGVMANDVGVYGVKVLTAPTHGAVTLNSDGTFTYVPNSGTVSDSFEYQANGNAAVHAAVTLGQCTGNCIGLAPTANSDEYTSTIASKLQISPPGVLANDSDPDKHPLIAVLDGAPSGVNLTLNPDGSFSATPTTPGTVACAIGTPAGSNCFTFSYHAVNSQNTASGSTTVTLTYLAARGLQVTVQDAQTQAPILDYRWIIEEDRTFQVTDTVNTGANVPSLGTSFHTSYMPVVAAGCVGPIACESGQQVLDTNKFLADGTTSNPTYLQHVDAVCDVGNGACRPGTQKTEVNPSQVALDPNKHYYISILPGDGANPFLSGAGGTVPVDPNNPDGDQRRFDLSQDCGEGVCGHGMGGAQIAPQQTNVTVNLEPTPLPTAKIAVYVFQDDWPLNGEIDTGGGVDALATQETGLGGFEITLQDQAGGFGDSVGQPTYDMFGMPLSNALAGTIDQLTGRDACPISKKTDGLVGMIVTCPHFESDGVTPSPLEGQALISNLYPGVYEVVATPGAGRIAKGEVWLQTNSLDGTKGLEAMVKAGEPAYFQEFGPAGYHVAIGFANPAIINGRQPEICASATAHCTNTVTGRVTTTRISRSPDQRLYSSGSYDANGYTQCYASLGDVDGEDFAFTKCDDQGRFSFSNIPDGTWRVTVFDQWNDLLVDGLSTPIAVSGGVVPMGDIPMQQWRTNIYNRTYIDSNRDGVSQDDEPGLPLVPINVRFRDGSFSNFNSTDLAGFAGFNEVFPYFNWLVVEADTTRYKQTGVHVVYDAGGPVDAAGIATGLASTTETNHLPVNLRVPGALYCADADCSGAKSHDLANPSTGRIDPAWVTTEGLQGFIGSAEFIEFGKVPFAENENGGIKGHVIYMSTRPFDDPALLLQLSWTPAVPNVTVNLYQEGTAPDGTKSLKLVDTTKTSSWDEFAQGFRSNGVPNMNCPGQDATSPFFFTLAGSTQWLDPSSPKTSLPNNSQYKCYDGMHMFNQVQPAPYDGLYQFPSIIGRDPQSGAPTGTGIAVNPAGGSRPGSNCTICVANPADQGPMLPVGKYVVEMVVPPGYELVKEEDKNILLGDNYIAPVTQQFGGFGNIFIMPDQAAVASTYNPNNPLNQTTDLGAQPRHEGDTGSIETFWPCVGQARVVPEFVSLFPGSGEVSPFAGATRNLCDRKEVTLEDQMSVLAKFYVFSSTHVAAHFTGIITDDFSSEFDPFSPQFGEKFAVPNLPISFKDFNGVEVSRTSSDQWGFYNGLNFSSWEVNPPSPSGYVPQMMVTCMNDPGPIPGPDGTMITDPLYNSNYSQFCYEWGFMPGQTAYMDTPVIPTTAFAEAYNPVDCAYPDTTPAIKSVIGNDATGATAGSGKGPWVSGSGTGHTLTITSLGLQSVLNNAYSGPSADGTPFNQKKITRNYGFGDTPGTVALVGSDGVPRPLTGVSWSNTTITGTVPTNVPSCPLLQRGTGAGTTSNRFPANCGELVITAANGKQSIDTVTVTIGGRAPKVVAAGQTIQSVIDSSQTAAGDLILVPAGSYNEILVMWKPVRLQGVGAASVTVNANTHPAGKMDTWRRQVNCLFGLSLNGGRINGQNPFDPTGTFTCAFNGQAQADPLPLEPLVGWDPALNGNIAELLQEPTLLGAYEGAGITVVGKGLLNPNTPGVCDALDANGCIQLTTNQCSNSLTTTNPNARSNFLCNPSRIDGMSFVNSSQGGGAIFLHGWNHNTEVSNNRVNANVGTLTGGITIGQMETPEVVIAGTQQPAFGFDRNVNVHHNSITQNASLGDELNSTTPSAAGGVTFCTGSDSYRFNHNWVCGNLSSGDGGGFAHFGLSYNGNISNNWFLFNQSFNPTIPTYGGGVLVAGAPPDGPVCENATQDQDCPPQLSDGSGPGLVIDSNLIQGNTAESGSGGGLRLQSVNGTEVARNPGNPGNWYQVTITNNIIANNVAGWDGGGVSLQDALRVNFINNTVMTNDSTASSGVLFNTHGAANSSTPPPDGGSGNGSGCTPQPDPNQPQNPGCVNPVSTSTNQPAGLVAIRNTSNLIASLPGTIICPVGNNSSGDSLLSRINGSCRQVSYPALRNNLFWQNRPFHITVGAPSATDPLLSQQNTVILVPTLNQAATGTCPNGATYWDIGIRGDTGPTNHSSGFTLGPQNSILTDFFGSYSGNGNIAPTSPGVVSQYCNGSRVPPENGGLGYNVPPGIADAQVPNPVFNLTPAATVDEGNNWINMAYGPLTLSNLSGAALGDSRICGGPGAPGASCLAPSPAINTAAAAVAPNHDFFGTARPQNGAFDIGAVEFAGTIVVPPPTRPTPSVLDDFNRANANTLNNGSNWSQLVVLANAGIRVNGNQAFCINTGLAAVLCLPGTAYWNNPTGGFGARQAAAFTFANTTLNGDSLILKATGSTNILGLQATFIRVRYSTASSGQVIVETTTNNGGSYTTQGTLSGFGGFANGDTMTAMVDATGTVYVWKNTADVPIGTGVTLGAAWTGGGRIGIQLPGGARVDNFAGGTAP